MYNYKGTKINAQGQPGAGQAFDDDLFLARFFLFIVPILALVRLFPSFCHTSLAISKVLENVTDRMLQMLHWGMLEIECTDVC